MTIEVLPATSDRWDDLVAVFDRRGDDPSWCWCQPFLRATPDRATGRHDDLDNRSALRQEITDAAVPPGMIAYIAGEPVGWTRVGPRSDFPRLRGNRALRKVLGDEDLKDQHCTTWWVTCFAVNSKHRRSGAGSALLDAAVQFAAAHDADAVEGHPVDVAALSAARVSGSAIYTGTVAMFSAAGFNEVARTFPTRPVMRLLLGGHDPARGTERG